jgi:uncharacterized membrane protein YfcA
LIWVILLGIGLFAGTLGSLIGLGGGIIIVPALLYFRHSTSIFGEISPQLAVGTSLVIMIFTGLSSTISYMKIKMVDYRTGFLLFIGSGPGSLLGAWMNKFLDLHSFNLYFGIFILFVALLLMVRNRLKPMKLNSKKTIKREIIDVNGDVLHYEFPPVLATVVAFIIGLAGGLFGIGGGSLMVPAMVLMFAFPPRVAVATSMMIIFLSAVVSSITHIALGNVNWLFVLALVPGAWFGARLGAFLNTKLKSDTLVLILRLVLLVIGIQLIYEGLVT